MSSHESMKEVEEFISEFCRAEHAVARAMLTEADIERYHAARLAAERFAPAFRLTAHLPRFADDRLPPFAQAVAQLHKEFSPRRLLRLRAYQVGSRLIYAADLTGTMVLAGQAQPAATTYVRLLVERVADQLQIISRQNPPTFAFPYWETTGGEDLRLPDTPVAEIVYEAEEGRL